MSEAKEGKLFGQKKLLDPLLGTTEGTKITSTMIFYTSHALTVYSNVYPSPMPEIFSEAQKNFPRAKPEGNLGGGGVGFSNTSLPFPSLLLMRECVNKNYFFYFSTLCVF